MSHIAAGKYRLLRLIGAGGMGEVFEAENTDTHKRVAIKQIRGASGVHREALDRLLQEARGSALVRHPNAVDVYDLVRDGDTAYLIMEYLEGEPLSAAIDRADVPMHRMVAHVLGAMRGVAAAHRQGVIHRDIKPDNIFLAREDDTPVPVPKVLDFGVCKLRASEPGALSLTRSGHLMGTPLYMPLEQLEGRSDVDGRVDVYAFGVTLYQAVTGLLPIQATTLTELIVKLSAGDIPPPSAQRPDLPRALDRLIMWALAPHREQRLSSLEAFIDELEPFASEREYGQDAAQEPTRSAAKPAPGSRPTPLRAAPSAPASAASHGSAWRTRLFAVGLVAVLVALLGLWLHRAESADGAAQDAVVLARPAPPAPSAGPATAQQNTPGTSTGDVADAPPLRAAAEASSEQNQAAPHGQRLRAKRSARSSLADKSSPPTESATAAAPSEAGPLEAEPKRGIPRGRPMRSEEF